MMFLNPMLLLGLAGVALPIAIHLFNRFRPKSVEWAAMELLRSALASRAKQVKVEDWLLLLLRCLAVLLLALALSRPTLTTSNVGGFGGSPRVGVVLAIDGSFSMGHRAGVASRFDAAVGRAREVLETLEPGSPLTLVLLADRSRILLRNTGYEPDQVEPLLRDLAPLPEAGSVDASVELLQELVTELRSPVREVYLVTDAQSSTWGTLSPGAQAAMQRLGEAGTVAILPVFADRSDNLALTRFELTAGVPRAGASARYLATIRNFGDQPQRNVRVRLMQDGQAVDQRVIDELAPGAVADASLTARFTEPGAARLSAVLEDDPLLTDNTRYRAADVRSGLRVLIVDGEPGGGRFEGQAGFFAAALAPRTGRGVEVEQVSWLDLPSVRYAAYDAVVLANVPDVGAAAAAELRAFVESGGGLLVALGDQTDGRVYNPRLVEGEPILPGRLGDAVGEVSEAAQGRSLRIAEDHPVTRVLAALPADLLDEARVRRAVTLEPLEGAGTLLWLQGEAESPLLLTRALGQGRVMLFGTTLNREWTNLPVHPAFPIFAQQAISYLTRRAWEEPRSVGDALRVALPPGAGAEVRFLPPGDAADPIAVQPIESGGRVFAELPEASEPGFYTVESAAGAPIVLAVNVDTNESDVHGLSVSELEAAVGDPSIRVVEPGADIASAVRELRVGRELWKPLALLALAAFALEGWLAARFSSRSREPVSFASATGRESMNEGAGELAEAA